MLGIARREDAIDALAGLVVGDDELDLAIVGPGYQSFDCTWPLLRTRMSTMARS